MLIRQNQFGYWNAKFVLGSTDFGGIILRSEDKKPELKLLRVLKEKDSFEITYGFEVPAPLDKKLFKAEWHLGFYEGNWKEGVEIHRKWLEKAFDLRPFSQHSNFPKWAGDINFILEVWGARRDRINPAHSFDEMRERINDFSKICDPQKTLLYLAGFAEHGIDSNAPDYNPSPQCGGESKFKLLIDEAHSLGYKVMIHTNVLAMTFNHRLYSKFKKFQVIDSITEVHGMEGQVAWREVHPVSSYLFGKYTRLTAHLLTKHPSHPMFAFQEKSYDKLGVIPALVLYTSDQQLNISETKNMITRASTLKPYKDLS